MQHVAEVEVGVPSNEVVLVKAIGFVAE